MVSGAIVPHFYGLITKERAEKFDLLGQLILNQREAIILCGAEGIGKTTLLNNFKNARENIWAICLLQGLETLDFEQIQAQLIATIQKYNPELGDHNLQSALGFCEQQNQKAVLIIDNAVNLASGLIRELIEYALDNPVLRIVFAFTRKQLYSKNSTDSVLDDCYFMEIPMLTKSQLAVFLKDSTEFSVTENESGEISGKLLKKLYQRTAGIPGKVIAQLPDLIKNQQKKTFSLSLKAGLMMVAVLASMISFGVYKKIHDTNLASALLPTNSLPLKSVKPLVKQDVQATVKQNNKAITSDKTKPLSTLEKTTEPQVTEGNFQQDADEQWILQQTTGKYTLQLMALSNRQALLYIVKTHQNLQSELKVLRTKSRNQERYVLLYGSFADTKTAYTAARLLPLEFRQAWPRQIKSLQREVKNRTSLLLKSNQSPAK